jgi:hypothetical protein
VVVVGVEREVRGEAAREAHGPGLRASCAAVLPGVPAVCQIKGLAPCAAVPKTVQAVLDERGEHSLFPRVEEIRVSRIRAAR